MLSLNSEIARGTCYSGAMSQCRRTFLGNMQDYREHYYAKVQLDFHPLGEFASSVNTRYPFPLTLQLGGLLTQFIPGQQLDRLEQCESSFLLKEKYHH